ncbi:MAG: HAD family hydrolase [Candidatus Nanopelagicaceae bacterium]
MKRPKLIGTDLDGTIVPFDRPISQRTIDAFTKANSLGIEIYFVTGRPPRWMKQVRDAFNFGTGICGNGALLYDFHGEKILDSWLINPKELMQGATTLRKVIPGAAFAVENFEGFHRERNYNPRWDKGQDDLGVSLIEEHLRQPAIKFLVRSQGDEISADEMLALADAGVGEFLTVTHSNPDESLLEISAHGVSKGSTLEKVAARLGISKEDAVTFGDNPNDLSMLAWAGRSYAMKTGHPSTHAIATGIAPECNNDGVAQIIEELLELPE